MSYRKICFITFFACGILLGAGFFIEYQFFIEPCPLCLLQRGVFICIALISIIGVLKLSTCLRYIHSTCLFIFSLLGCALSARQIWLQYFVTPENIPSCSAGLQRLIEHYPLLDAIKFALQGSGECAQVDFTIFGLSIAIWSFMSFLSLAIVAIWLFRTK